MHPLARAATLATLAVVLTAGTAEAQQISACYTNKNGTMYRVGVPGTPADCTNAMHKKDTWSAAPAGLTGYQTQTFDLPIQVQTLTPYEYALECPAGKRVVNAGWKSISEGGPAEFVGGEPIDGGVRYRFSFRNPYGNTRWVRIWITCVTAS